MASDRDIVIVAHNIRSLWNVGSFFRTADAFGVKTIYLTGYTAVPPRKEINKTALGAEKWIKWVSKKDPQKVIRRLKKEKYEIVALELTKESMLIQKYHPGKRIALIVGNEILGVPAELLKLSDKTVCIPMKGKKESLNVAVALGIALFNLSSF